MLFLNVWIKAKRGKIFNKSLYFFGWQNYNIDCYIKNKPIRDVLPSHKVLEIKKLLGMILYISNAKYFFTPKNY